MLGRVCLYALFWNYELLRNILAMCELLSYELILDLCYELCWNWMCWNWAINCIGTVTSIWIVSYVGLLNSVGNIE